MDSLGIEEKGRNSATAAASPSLSALEVEVIDLFVELFRVLGQPRSHAEIYGLLFISARPLAMDEVMERLRISKGSASQGLKFLGGIGAVRMVYVAGDRRTHYEAVAELRKLTTRYLREEILPYLDRGQARLERISAMVKDLPASDRPRANGRVTMLRSWSKNSRRVLPLVIKVLGH